MPGAAYQPGRDIRLHGPGRVSAGPAAVAFIADNSLYATPARAIASYWQLFERCSAAGAAQIRIAGDVPHEGNGGRFAGWDRYESAANTVWDRFPVWSRCLYDATTAALRQTRHALSTL